MPWAREVQQTGVEGTRSRPESDDIFTIRLKNGDIYRLTIPHHDQNCAIGLGLHSGGVTSQMKTLELTALPFLLASTPFGRTTNWVLSWTTESRTRIQVLISRKFIQPLLNPSKPRRGRTLGLAIPTSSMVEECALELHRVPSTWRSSQWSRPQWRWHRGTARPGNGCR